MRDMKWNADGQRICIVYEDGEFSKYCYELTVFNQKSASPLFLYHHDGNFKF